MEKEPFRSARAKIKRAKELGRQIDSLIANFEGLYLAPIQSGPDRIDWTIMIKDDPTEEMATILGDALHNARTALDHAAIDVVAQHGSAKGVHFPFAEKAEDLDLMIKKKNFHRAPPEAIALLKSLRPYRGGDDALRALHDLDILDKHQDLISLTGLARQPGTFRFGSNTISDTVTDVRHGKVLISAPGRGAFALSPMRMSLTVQFHSKSPFFAREPLVPTINALTQLSESIVEAFAAL